MGIKIANRAVFPTQDQSDSICQIPLIRILYIWRNQLKRMKTILPALTKHCFFFLLALLPLGLFAQTPPPDPEPIIIQKDEPKHPVDPNYVYPYVDESAEFPGGRTALYTFLADNIVYPKAAWEKGIQGRCYLKFVVSKTGEISDVKVLRGVPDCPECDAEALRVVKLMPKWKPGKNGSKEVNSYFNLPVSFKIPVEENKQ
jgi:TonB family protein